MEAMIPLFLVSLVVGLVVGVLAGLLGIGGGMLLVPAFKLGYAMDSLMCTATSLFTIIPTSISGAVSHIRNKTCLPVVAMYYIRNPIQIIQCRQCCLGKIAELWNIVD